jgi:methylglutaconyl-CoA hydratase
MSLYLKEINKNVCTITLNRPDIHNAFNDELITSLITEFNSLAKDDAVRVVILTGAGMSFCAGADLNWMKQMVSYSFEQNMEDSMNLANLFSTIDNFPKPVVGKINGAALGGGSGLVAVCDHVIAAEDAKFGFTEVRLGLIPAVISPYVIRKIGESHARTLFLTGERFDAKKAMEIGLVHKVSLDRYFERDTQEIVDNLLKAGPQAQAQAKSLIKGVKARENDIEEYKKYTCEMIAKMRVSQEGQEGMNALLEKRKANWLEK